MASIRKLPNGTFEGTVSAGRDSNGKQIRFYVTHEKEKECIALARELEQSVYDRKMGINNNSRSDYIFDKWFELNKSRLSETTPRNYETYINRYKKFFRNEKLGKITHIHIEEFMRLLREGGILDDIIIKKCSSSTQRKYFFVLSEILGWALKHRNPCKEVTPPRKTECKYYIYSSDEFMQLRLYLLGRKDELQICIAGMCGLRLGEVYGLKWENIDLKSKLVKIRKTIVKTKASTFIEKSPKSKSGIRDVFISDEMKAMLQEYQKKTGKIAGYLFYCDGDNPEAFSKRFQNIIKKAGLPKTRFHDLRHYRATELLHKGFADLFVQNQLGHADIYMTKKYQHINSDILESSRKNINKSM